MFDARIFLLAGVVGSLSVLTGHMTQRLAVYIGLLVFGGVLIRLSRFAIPLSKTYADMVADLFSLYPSTLDRKAAIYNFACWSIVAVVAYLVATLFF
jgi:hypothetical protein